MNDNARSIKTKGSDTVKMKKRQPDASAAGFAIAMGVGGLAIALFSSLSPGQKFGAAAGGCMGLSWGLNQGRGSTPVEHICAYFAS